MTAEDVLRQALAAFGPATPYATKAAHDAVVKASKGVASKSDPVVAALAKLFTKSRGGVDGAKYVGGADQLLQALLRESAETGLPALAERVLATWPTPILVPVFRQPAGWDAKELKKQRQPHDTSRRAAFTPDGKEALTVSPGGKVARWSLETGALLDSHWSSRGQSLAIWVTPSERVLVFTEKDGQGLLVAAGGGKSMVLVETEKQPAFHAPALSADGKVLAVLAQRSDKTAVVSRYEVNTGRGRDEPFQLASPAPLLFLPDGRLAAGDGAALTVADGDDVTHWKLPSPPLALALSPDGARLNVQLADSLIVLDAKSGKPVKAPGALAYVDVDTGLRVDGHAVEVFRISTGAPLARYVADHQIDAVADPKSGAIVVTSVEGPGSTEVLKLRRPGPANSAV